MILSHSSRAGSTFATVPPKESCHGESSATACMKSSVTSTERLNILRRPGSRLAFIEAKREPGRLRMFNLSVLVTDAFMQAVAEDSPWQLSFGGTVAKVLPARELWDKIMRATYAYAR